MGQPIANKIGVVIPTLGTRTSMLQAAILSANLAGADFIVVVAKSNVLGLSLKSPELVNDFCLDRGKGLASAITDGFRRLPDDVAFISWLGDDDYLEPNSLLVLRKAMENDTSEPSFAFGRCSYIDLNDNQLFEMPTGMWANFLMRIGPQLVSQPACLFRRSAFEVAGGLDESLRWAFDLDLLLRLNELSKPAFVDHRIAKFRWHSDSLSVKARRQSVREAQGVRRRHARGAAQLLLLFNPIISQMIRFAGTILSKYAARTRLRK